MCRILYKGAVLNARNSSSGGDRILGTFRVFTGLLYVADLMLNNAIYFGAVGLVTTKRECKKRAEPHRSIYLKQWSSITKLRHWKSKCMKLGFAFAHIPECFPFRHPTLASATKRKHKMSRLWHRFLGGCCQWWDAEKLFTRNEAKKDSASHVRNRDR